MTDNIRADSFWTIDAGSALDRALRYPYDLPGESYVFCSGKRQTLHGSHEALIKGKVPVLAYGSNAAPEALDRKFRDFDALYADPIPVLFGKLHNFAIVYSAQFSPYGALPATIEPVSGAVANTYVTFLSPEQLQRMHETEDLGLYYSYEKIDHAFVFQGQVFPECYAYVALGGSLHIDGQAIALQAVNHQHCPLKLVHQQEAQKHAMQILGLEMPIERFIVENALDLPTRNTRFEALSRLAGNIWQAG